MQNIKQTLLLDYPDKTKELYLNATRFYYYLQGKKAWWRGEWQVVETGEGGKQAILESLILRVIGKRFNYNEAFKDYSRQLFRQYGATRVFNDAVSLDANYTAAGHTGYEVYDYRNCNPWQSSTETEALEYVDRAGPTFGSAPCLAAAPPAATLNALARGGRYRPPIAPSPPGRSMVERLDRLTPNEREVLETFSNTKSYQETADLLGKGYETVKSTIKAARKKLRFDREPMKASEAGSLGLHNRWHRNRNIVKEGCAYCDG